MTADDLRNMPTPPDDVRPELLALWFDAHDQWDRAHQVVQEMSTPEAAWVHAYLHRREGDASNARYWYERARQPVCRLSLDEEWVQVADALLSGAS